MSHLGQKNDNMADRNHSNNIKKIRQGIICSSIVSFFSLKFKASRASSEMRKNTLSLISKA